MNTLRIATLTFALLLTSGEAFAACQEQKGLLCGTGAASLASPGGVQVSRGGKFRPLASGTALRGGDRVLSGANPATLSLGESCSAAVAPGSLVALSRSGGRTCARVSQAPRSLGGPQAGSGVQGPGGVQGAGGAQPGAVGVQGPVAVQPGVPVAPGLAAAPVAGVAPALTAVGVAAGVATAVGVGVATSSSDRNPPVSAQ